MREAIAGLADQLRWSAALEVPRAERASEVLVCAVGGSMYAGEAAGIVAAEDGLLVHLHRGYGLPKWAFERRPHVIAVTYSGNTEETNSSLDQASELGLPISIVSSGGRATERAGDSGWSTVTVPAGLPPRVAAGFQIGSVLRLLESIAGLPDSRSALEAAAEVVDRQVVDAAPLADELADALEHHLPVIMGGNGVGAVAAVRWKTQINENSKLPAFAVQIPEANHNDLEGWGGGSSGRLALVALHDVDDHPRVRMRLTKTMADLAGTVVTAGNVHARGDGPLARL
ncbi:MAG: hypothetical protein KJO18_07940, partial [Acidimicrobiia bacterium]|nr:hypothetical protein [Acidimicrobiia bacterium]